jgi:hypothetical protein
MFWARIPAYASCLLLHQEVSLGIALYNRPNIYSRHFIFALELFGVFFTDSLPMAVSMPIKPILPITLPPLQDLSQEKEWLKIALHRWLDQEFIPEAINAKIAERASEIFLRQRLEGENDLGSLVIAIVTEMQAFDFRESFYSEFAIANAVSDLILDSLGIDRCCGQG